MSSALDIREHLLQSSDEFRKLAKEHSAYDEKTVPFAEQKLPFRAGKARGSDFEEVEAAGQGPNAADDSSPEAAAGLKVRVGRLG